MTTLLTFMSGIPTLPTSMLVLILVFYFILQNRLKLQQTIHDIKEKYDNRTFNYIDEIIEEVTMTAYSRMTQSCFKNIKSDTNIEMEKLLYFLILENTFKIQIRSSVRNYIRQNGFKDFDNVRLTNYIKEKGDYIYDKVVTILRTRANLLPNIAPHLGENYKVEESIEMYGKVIDNTLKNYKAQQLELKKAKAESVLIIGKVLKTFVK